MAFFCYILAEEHLTSPNYMKKILSIGFLLLLASVHALGTEPPRHHVIIDTDGSPDDLRALNMILSSGNTEVLAITSADGTLEPEEGFMKIQALLNSLGHEGIVTSQGIITKNEPSPLRILARQVSWGEDPLSYSEPEEVKELLVKVIEQEEKPVDIISLGPLTNIANAVLMKPSVKSQISKIIWVDQCQSDIAWSNYGMDCLSADYLLGTRIPVYRIIPDDKLPAISSSFVDSLEQMSDPYARSIFESFQNDSMQMRLKDNRLRVWNELAALYLYKPNLFTRDETYPDSAGQVMKVAEKDSVLPAIQSLLRQPKAGDGVIFSQFPADSASYQADMQPLIERALCQYGIQEWRAITLTAELQGRLDVSGVIGAKMGVRILDYFHTYPGQFDITSYCGIHPPLSGMNEGLQVACKTTGNTGLQIKEDKAEPRARVRFHDRQIEISLREDYNRQMQDDLEQINSQYEFGTAGYRQAIREKALQYWLEWDRKDVFRITRR
jgi:inosine-uridine nucleoside N-ribohydrolase